jgi:nucleotide-binding universal stress UspA family protein
LDKIKMTHRLMDGGLIFNINKAIKEDKIDYVVMGTEGASGWSAFFSGTNTGAALSDVEVPLLSIPLEAKFKKIKTIGFTTRFRAKDKKALKKVLEIAKMAGAEIKCLYVKTSKSDVTKDMIKKWEKYFEEEPIEFFVITSNEVKETILDFILYQEIDFLTMLTYKRSFFEGIFHPSLTKKFANSFEVPILAIPIE